jgi:MerR family transcriptional regulator, heat shock protein HspR
MVDTDRIKMYIQIGATLPMAPKQELYFISTAARLLGMHPQTLRKYERLGLVQPARTIGSVRVYTGEEIERLRLIKHLVDEFGINLAGVQRLLTIAEALERIRSLTRDDILARLDGRRRLAQELERLCGIVGL